MSRRPMPPPPYELYPELRGASLYRECTTLMEWAGQNVGGGKKVVSSPLRGDQKVFRSNPGGGVKKFDQIDSIMKPKMHDLSLRKLTGYGLYIWVGRCIFGNGKKLTGNTCGTWHACVVIAGIL